MPSPAELARAHYRHQAALARRAAAAVEALWVQLDPGDLSGSFTRLGPRMVGLVSLAQYAAAAAAAQYVTDTLTAQDVPAPLLAEPDPRAFAGTASDGRDLLTLLEGGVIQAKTLIGAGAPLQEAFLSGQARSVLATANEVQQAGRNADHIAITSSRAAGFVRMVNPPCCSRCAILAGRFYRWSSGFDRHPSCDCVHAPSAEARGVEDVRTDPLELVRSGKVTGLSKAETDAVLNQGADLNQVVNAHRQGMYRFGVTDEGATVRQGRAGRQIAKQAGVTDPGTVADGRVGRLTVRAIYAQAGGDRLQVIELLTRNGYMRHTWTPEFRRSIRQAYRDLGVEWNAGTRYAHT